jgi:hypothetical protein
MPFKLELVKGSRSKDRFWRGRLLPYGVYYDRKNQTFELKPWIRKYNKQKRIGYYKSFADAVSAAWIWEKKVYGDVTERTDLILKRYHLQLNLQLTFIFPEEEAAG